MRLNLFVLIGTFLTSLSSFAQDTLLRPNYILVAVRNSEHSFYKPGTRLVIKYNDGSSEHRVRGAFAGVINGSVALAAKAGNERLTLLPVEDIYMVRKIHPQRRLASGIIGTVLVGGGAALLGSGGNSPGSAMRGALIIPVIGIGSYFLLAVPVTLIIEKLNEKKRNKGWKFELLEQ